MKKIICNLAFVSVLFAFTACGSTNSNKNDSTVQDSYTTVEKIENEDISDSDDDVIDVSNENTGDVYDDEIQNYQKTKKEKSFLDSVLASSFVAYPYNEFSVFSINTFYKMKQYAATAVYVPENEKFGFGASTLGSYCYLQFDESERTAIINAYNQYLKDFENKKLNRKGKSTYKAYGKTMVRMNWGTLKSSTPNYCDTQCYLGYEFKDGSPYFKLSAFTTLNEYYKENNFATKDSIPLNYYFTKAQGAALVDCLSKNAVDAAVRSYEKETFGGDIIEADEF